LQAIQISENIHALKHSFNIPVNPEVNLKRFVYSFIIFNGENIHLIDSGVSSSGESILKYIRDKGREVKNIKHMILTHSHPDHIGSAKYIQEISGCKILAHKNEKDWIEDIDTQFSDRPVPGFKNLVDGSVLIDQFLNDNETIKLEDDLLLEVIHTPGHSIGSVSLYIKNEKVLFSGDSILLPGELPIYENFNDTISSIKRLKQIKDLKVLLSSWDEPVFDSDIQKKMDQSIGYLLNIHKTIKNISKADSYPPIDLCKAVVEKMGLPDSIINPLVAKSFQSNLKSDAFKI
jgi:hydroxyacylglutathione hydrolase